MTTSLSKAIGNFQREYIFSQVISENAIEQINVELESVNKRLTKLKAVAAFLALQSQHFDQVHCFISNIRRTKEVDDDIATFMIRIEQFEAFDVCINAKDDFKVQQIAYKVHNLSLNRRTTLVDKLRKCTGPSAPTKRAMTIHRVRNFEVRKI